MRLPAFSKSKEFKASVVFVFASVCSQGIALISLPVFTRILSTEQMGVVTMYNTWLNLIGMITTLGLTSGSFNIAMMQFGDKRAQYTSSALTLSLVVSVPLFVLSFPFGDFFSALLGLSVPLIHCMCAMLVLSPAINLWLMRQRYEYRYISVFVITVINSVIGTLFAIVAVVTATMLGVTELPEVRLFASSAVSALIAFAVGAFIFIKGKTFFNKCYWVFALRTGFPLIVHSVAKYILDASDKILIGIFVGSAAVGIYGVLYSISSISLVFWSAINSALIPFIFERLKVDEGERVRSVATPLLVSYLIICLLLMLFAPEVVDLLATESYEEAVYLVPPIASGIFFTSLYNLYSNLILFKGRTVFVMLATVVAATVNIGLNIIFLPIFGYIAAAYTTLVSCSLLALMQYLFSKKLKISYVLNNRFNLLLSIIVIVTGIAINLLYPIQPLIRYSIILAILIMLIVFRKKIIYAYHQAKTRE